jgi:hypothetical protein
LQKGRTVLLTDFQEGKIMKKKRNLKARAIDPKSELERIKRDMSARKNRRTWSNSKLQKFHAELVQLRQTGASLAQLRFWLRTHRMSAAITTIRNFLMYLGIEKGKGENNGAI